MQFCNTSFCQRGQHSVALNHYVVARRASTNHDTQQSALTQKLRQYTNYISTVQQNDNRLYEVMTSFVQRLNICSSKSAREKPTAPSRPLVTRLATMTNDHVDLSWSVCYNRNPQTAHPGYGKTNLVLLEKSATDNKTVVYWLNHSV